MRHTPGGPGTCRASGAPGKRPCPDHWYGTDPWYPTVDLALDTEPRYRARSLAPSAAVPRHAPSGPRPPVRLTRRGRRVVATGMASVVVTGLLLVADGLDGGDGPPQPASAAAPASSARQPPPARTSTRAKSEPPAGPGPGSVPVPVLEYSRPTRIRIPSIGVDAPLMPVGLDDKGEIGTPPPMETNLAAWYQGSSAPGADGTSVIVGHVDNMSGPSVFFSLGALKKGSTVEVPRQNGTTAVFAVYGIEVVPRDDFPGERVYGNTGQAELRVITCGGSYRPATGYSANVVVFARLLRTA